MGLSLLICSDIRDIECQNSLSPAYFTFTHGYELYKKSSVLAQIGRYYKINTSLLGKYIAFDAFADKEANQTYIQNRMTDIDSILLVVIALRNKIKENKKFVDVLKFKESEAAHKDSIISYLLSEKFIIDLSNLIDSIECYREKGASKVFLGFNG